MKPDRLRKHKGSDPAPGRLLHRGVERARRIGDHKHIKPFRQRRQGREGYTHIRHHTGNDQLLAASGLDCLDEIFVVPGVDLTRASDVWRVREHFFQLWNQRAIRTLFETGGEDSWQLEEFSHVSQSQYVVLELIWREVLHQGNQTGLVVDQQNYGVVFVQAVVGGVSHGGILFRSGFRSCRSTWG